MTMGASEGKVGMNTQIKMGDGESPEVFSLIPEPKDIDGPEVTLEFADFTHQQSPNGFRERKPTVKSNSQVTFRCNKLAGNVVQDALIAAANANPPTPKNFQMIYPDGDQINFIAYVSVKFSAPILNAMELQVTLSLEGAFTPA
jgi:hypothetical protein